MVSATQDANQTLFTNYRDQAITAITTGLARVWPQQASGLLNPPPRRILILKPCCLGDLIMATPTIRALRDAYPTATIHLAVGHAARAAVLGNPRLDSLLDSGPIGTGRAPWSAYVRLIRQLRGGGYDTAITLDRSPALGLLPWLAGIPRRIGLDSAGRGFAHTIRIPAPPDAPRHEAEVYLDTLRAIGLTPTAPRLEFFPTADHATEIKRLKVEDWSSVSNPQSLVLIHPAGGVNPGMTLLAKRWPTDRFAQLADRLADDLAARVVIVGGPGDIALGAEVRQHARLPVLDLTGQLSLGGLASLMRHAALYIGNDTGATHLAVAMGAPTIMLMGPTDPRRYGPYRPSAPHTVASVAPPDARPGDYQALRHAALVPAAEGRSGETSPLAIERISVNQVYTIARTLYRSGL